MEFKLILKKLNNTLTKKEEIIFNDWYNESNVHKNYFARVKENYDKDLEVVDAQKGWLLIKNKIKKRARTKPYWKYAVAVSIVFLISLTFIFRNDKAVSDNPVIVNNNAIEVGTDKATLTLEDGSNIVLQKGESYEANRVKSNGEQLVYKPEEKLKSAEVVYNYLTIPRGGQFTIQLSDGTKVWLNSDSKLKYPVAFNDNASRKVELIYGEAYFDVSPSTEHNNANFVVTTRNQDVVVLGTEFNIKAYKEDTIIATTLVEGKVTVNNSMAKKDLVPGYQSRFNSQTNEISVIAVDVYNEISWKNGFFSFKNKPLKDIMIVLSRWYDVDIVFDNNNAESITFNGVFNKKQSIEEILSIIENTKEATFETNGKTIIMK